MALHVVAVGTRMPAWVGSAVAEYGKRMPRELALQWREVKAEHRGPGADTARCRQREAERLEAALPTQALRVLLDERGDTASSEQLAGRLADWQSEGRPIAFLIGGADGFDPAFAARAHRSLRLSDLTLPHPVVRVVLAEQLYRAWTILSKHPYHRA